MSALCAECEGTGNATWWDAPTAPRTPCKACGGTGTVRRNRRAMTVGVVRGNRIGGVRVLCDGFGDQSAPDATWYYRRQMGDGRVYTGPYGSAYAEYPRGTRPIPARLS